jgi:hypothetical protein
MIYKIKCQNLETADRKSVKIKVLKAPFVDSVSLRQVLTARKKAVVI